MVINWNSIVIIKLSRMISKKLFLYLFIHIAIISCSELREPEFKKLEEIKVHSIKNGNINIRGEAVFFNPNKRRLKLRNSYIEVYMKNKKAATIEQDYATLVPPNQEFKVPFKAAVPENSPC